MSIPIPPANETKPRLQHSSQAKTWSKVPLTTKSKIVAAAGLAMTAVGTLAPSTAPEPGNLDTLANGCSIEGSAKKSTQWEWSANSLKNRWHMPSSDATEGLQPPDGFNADVTLSMLINAPSPKKPEAGQDFTNKTPVSVSVTDAVTKKVTSFNEGQNVEIEGYIAYVKAGGIESCNCGSTDLQYMDTHIYVSPDKEHANAQSKPDCLIVEVTPRLRIQETQAGRDWSTPTLISSLRPGTHVRMMGYLFDDQEHRPNSLIDSEKTSTNIWRASCWELHPVTDIQILDSAESAPVTSKPNSAKIPGAAKPTATKSAK